MINFFRKKLADDNKPLKYMRYAIGEIVLVVIGILIELSINNWNENLKNRSKENQILTSLLTELISQKQQLSKQIKGDTISYSANDSLMVLSGSTNFHSIPTVDFRDLVYRVGVRNTFNPQLGTVEALLSSGELDLIRNEDLKIQLAGLKGRLEDYGEEDITIENFLEDQLNPYLRQKIPLYDQTDVDMTYKDSRKGNFLISDEQISNLLSDLYFNNLLGYGRYRYRVRAHEGRDLLAYYSNLAELVKNELEKSD